MSNKLIKTLSLSLGVTGAFFLNYFFIEKFIIPDPCYYHSLDAGILFNLFYDTPSVNGGHPFPSVINLIFTVALGLLIGWKVYKFFVSKCIESISNN